MMSKYNNSRYKQDWVCEREKNNNKHWRFVLSNFLYVPAFTAMKDFH